MGVRQTVYTRNQQGALGSLIGHRSYFGGLPENLTLPAIRCLLVSTTDADYREYGNATTRAQIRVQMDCLAKTSDGAAQLADAVRTNWDGWTNGTAVGRCRIASRIEDGWNDDIKAYREIVDVIIDHKLTARSLIC